jgi:hypothetical protein
MRTALIAGAVLAAFGSAAPVSAADLTPAPAYKAPPAAVVASLYGWSGFYIVRAGANYRF